MPRFVRALLAVVVVLTITAAVVFKAWPAAPDVATAASSCSNYRTQAAAQAAADTRDPNQNGLYCESLPCPCAGKSSGGSGSSHPKPTPPPSTSSSSGTSADPKGCRIVKEVVDVGLSRTKYPKVRAHWEHAIKEGWPRILTIHRKGASERRDKLLKGIPTAPGKDRDEYPPAAARTTVKADVALVDASENRGAGQIQGTKTRSYCSGQRFKFVWY